MQKSALVIGATGLLGYGVTNELYKNNWKVRAVGREMLRPEHSFPDGIEYICGDIYDESFLANALKNIDKVFFFIATTYPSTSSNSLDLEIMRTLRGIDYLLRSMRKQEVTDVVFPSSGGAIYGNVEVGRAKESDDLKPITPYGVGKKMCEEVLNFYSMYGISSTILRIGNVYGSSCIRSVTQGVIDIYIQKALVGEVVTVWGESLKNIRDYIFLDDFTDAVSRIAEYKSRGVEVYNLGSGKGTSLEEIIQIININLKMPLAVKYAPNINSSSIKRIVLDIEKISSKTGWKPRYDICSGIAETINRKKEYD